MPKIKHFRGPLWGPIKIVPPIEFFFESDQNSGKRVELSYEKFIKWCFSLLARIVLQSRPILDPVAYEVKKVVKS